MNSTSASHGVPPLLENARAFAQLREGRSPAGPALRQLGNKPEKIYRSDFQDLAAAVPIVACGHRLRFDREPPPRAASTRGSGEARSGMIPSASFWFGWIVPFTVDKEGESE